MDENWTKNVQILQALVLNKQNLQHLAEKWGAAVFFFLFFDMQNVSQMWFFRRISPSRKCCTKKKRNFLKKNSIQFCNWTFENEIEIVSTIVEKKNVCLIECFF